MTRPEFRVYRSVALGIAWRTVHNALTTPNIVIPTLAFPFFFFVAFAGGLSQLQHLPGFDYPEGYTAWQFVFVMLQSIFYICFALVVGVRFQAGVAGAFVILVLATTIAASFGMLGAYLALRTGSGESIQATFPFLFVFLFISSMNTPRNLIAVHWFRIAATINPVSSLIEGVRSLIITGWDATALGRAFAVACVLGLVSVVLASRALGRRMART